MGIFDTASLPSAVNSILNFGASLGWQQDRGLNPNLFVILQDKVSGTSVRARIISYSVSNQAEWANKFEGTDGDSQFSMTSAILQNGEFAKELDSETAMQLAGKTLITKAQSTQIWTGLQPQSISLELEFRAFSDPINEVEAPIQELTRMMSPILNDNVLDSGKKALEESKSMATSKGTTQSSIDKATEGKVLGVVPAKIAVSLFKKRFNATYRIESMEESVDEVKIDGSGNRVYQRISLSLGSSEGITKPDVLSPSALGLGSIMSIF